MNPRKREDEMKAKKRITSGAYLKDHQTQAKKTNHIRKRFLVLALGQIKPDTSPRCLRSRRRANDDRPATIP